MNFVLVMSPHLNNRPKCWLAMAKCGCRTKGWCSNVFFFLSFSLSFSLSLSHSHSFFLFSCGVCQFMLPLLLRRTWFHTNHSNRTVFAQNVAITKITDSVIGTVPFFFFDFWFFFFSSVVLSFKKTNKKFFFNLVFEFIHFQFVVDCGFLAAAPSLNSSHLDWLRFCFTF